MMEKHGDITENTPPDEPRAYRRPPGKCCQGRCKSAKDDITTQQADHPATRLADAVKDHVAKPAQ